MASLYHCYERSADGGLDCPLTGQRLRVLSIGEGELLFEYRDREVSLPIGVSFYPPGRKEGSRSVSLDWTLPQYADVRASYGLWRRVTWFLLDALLVWTYERNSDDHGVAIKGGWLDGEWCDGAACWSGLTLGGTHRDKLIGELAPFEPCPLNATAPTWSYEPGLAGAREGRIAMLDAGRPDLEVPIEQQLGDVPRFVGSDGAILFFHKVSPHVGPEYAPRMHYGLSLPDFAFYFSAPHASLIGEPIPLHPAADKRQAWAMEESPDWLSSFGEHPPRPRLHPRLREQLYFAMMESQRLSLTLSEAERPMMADLEFGQEMRFGHDLWYISEPPMSVGLPFCKIDYHFPPPPRVSAPQRLQRPAILPLIAELFGRRT